MSDYNEGFTDATNDLADGWVPEKFTLDSIVDHIRFVTGASDSYIAGYLAVLFK